MFKVLGVSEPHIEELPGLSDAPQPESK
jgi:hypothetical protein